MLKEYFEYLSIPMLLYFGYITAFGDIKSGRIPNRLIWLGVKLGLFWHTLYILFIMWLFKDRLFTEGIRLIEAYIVEFGINSAIGLAIGFFMWWVHMWAAGDAKLFSVFTFMIPVDFYSKFHVRLFPSFALLYNIFLCALVVVCFDFALKLVKRGAESRRSGEMREFIDKFVNRKYASSFISNHWKPWLRLILGLIFSFLITSMIRKYLSTAVEKLIPWKFTIDLKDIEINESIIFLLFFLLFRPLTKLYQNLIFYYITIFSLAAYLIFVVLYTNSPKILFELVHFGGLSILLIIFRKVYEFYSERINVMSIPLNELIPKTILSKKTIKQIETADKDFFKQNFELLFADGLTEDQINALKDWNKIQTIEISGTIPFAPCILAGVILTVAIKGILFWR